MKYLIISAISILGIMALSLRNTYSEPSLEKIEERPSNLEENADAEHTQFNVYWYAGLAEVSGYDLLQSRYGEIHEGKAAMIFVTEPFSKKKQVKLDNPGQAGKDNTSVLKLNSTRKFLTGIYPYSMMTSVFSPVNSEKYQNALKVTLTGQEWCGHVFQQANLKGSKYSVHGYSYFEAEGDAAYNIEKSYLEDELFNIVRINPDLLPKGNFEIVPSSVVSRFLHQDFKPYPATSTTETSIFNEVSVQKYTLKYTHNGRKLSIYYQAEFPHAIEGWEDTARGIGGQELTSKATRKNTKKLAYWSLNNKENSNLHEELFQ